MYCGLGRVTIAEEVAPPAAHQEWNPPYKEPDEGGPQFALISFAYVRAPLFLPLSELQFPPGPNERLGQNLLP